MADPFNFEINDDEIDQQYEDDDMYEPNINFGDDYGYGDEDEFVGGSYNHQPSFLNQQQQQQQLNNNNHYKNAPFLNNNNNDHHQGYNQQHGHHHAHHQPNNNQGYANQGYANNNNNVNQNNNNLKIHSNHIVGSVGITNHQGLNNNANNNGNGDNQQQASLMTKSILQQQQQQQQQNMLEDDKPRILLTGLRRSGKSSIQKVVFQKMSPHETLFLESTNKIIKNDISNNTFVQFQIWDFPGQVDWLGDTSNFECELIFSGCGAVVYVIDAQDNYIESITKLAETIQQAVKVNDQIAFEVFIHKMDGISDDQKMQIQQDIQQRLSDELNYLGIKLSPNVKIRYNLTSIYDHSIFEAFSRVIQKLIPQLPTLENLLDLLVRNSHLEKAFLFDVVSKIYIATDATPVENTTYELCSDMIDVVIDISCIYGNRLNNIGQETSTAYDEETGAVIKLNNGNVLYLREVNKYLALVCLLSKDSYEKVGLINYNFDCFKMAIEDVFQVRSNLQKTKREKKKKREQLQQEKQQALLLQQQLKK